MSAKLSKLGSQVGYYGQGLLRQLLPYGVARRQLDALLLKAAQHPARDEIDERVRYYNKMSTPFDASGGTRVSRIDKGRSRYYLDLDEISRGFGPDRRFHYLFGDVVTVPEVPTFVKSRPICDNNHNSVVLKLDRLRHFKFVRDQLPFRDKKNAAVWRGTPLNAQRQQFVRMFYNHPRFDIGHTRNRVDDLPPKGFLTRDAQIENKFFISIEGNDVATNLKWAMASNMLVMSPALRFETWFMEGRLQPGTHFVLLKDDFSDLEEKVAYYTTHTEEAEQIVRNAHAWVDLFRDPLKERVIGARVLEAYFRLSGQL